MEIAIAWRIRRSFRVVKGVRLNLSRGGLGLSAGVPGFRVGIGPRGAYRSIGIPGTGLYDVQYLGRSRGTRRTSRARPATPGAAAARPAVPRSPAGAPRFVGQAVPVPAQAYIPAALLILAFVLLFAQPATALLALAAGVVATAVLRRDPRVAASQALARSEALFRRGRYDAALQAAERCLALWPAASRAHHVAGRALLAMGRAGEAAPHYEHIPSDDPAFLFEKAAALGEAGRAAEALAILERVPAPALAELPARLLRARLLLAAGRGEVALEVLKEGPARRRIGADPGLLELHYLLGRAYEATGRPARATREYARVVAASPGFQDAAARLAALARRAGAKSGGGGSSPPPP